MQPVGQDITRSQHLSWDLAPKSTRCRTARNPLARALFKRRRGDSFGRFGNDAERAVTAREKRCAGKRQGTPSSMAACRVLMTLSRSSVFPACGAVSEASERVGSAAVGLRSATHSSAVAPSCPLPVVPRREFPEPRFAFSGRSSRPVPSLLPSSPVRSSSRHRRRSRAARACCSPWPARRTGRCTARRRAAARLRTRRAA